MNDGPHHYVESGLDYVWLADGFVREETPYGPAVIVGNGTALDRAIALHLIGHRPHLGGAEVRFLRALMDITQEGLARLLGKDAQSVARWERAKTNVPPTEDRALRQLFLESIGQPQPFTETARQVASIPDAGDGLVTASGTGDGGWVVSAG